MAYRLADPNPIYYDDEGIACAGGKLVFFDVDGTTPKNVYAEISLSTSLGNEIDLDASGRAEVDFWMSGVYDVQLLDAADQQVWLRTDFSLADNGTMPDLPDPATGTDGQVLGIDTGEYVLLDLEGLPDPTGFANGYLATDGETWFPATFPEAEDFDADNLPGGVLEPSVGFNVVIGRTRFLSGSGTISTSSGITASVAVTFADGSFNATPKIVCTATASGVTNNSPADDAQISAISKSSTGFTARAFCGAENNAGTIAITSNITFDYFAMGPTDLDD